MEISSWFNNAEDSDVVVRLADGNEIRAHKIVLKSQSDIFKVLLRSGMTESTTGVIEMREYESRAITSAIKFMYGIDVLSDIDSYDFIGLVNVADYLQIHQLMVNLQKCSYAFLDDSSIMPELLTASYRCSMNGTSKEIVETYFGKLRRLKKASEIRKLCNDLVRLDLRDYKRFRAELQDMAVDATLLTYQDCVYAELISPDKESAEVVLMDLLDTYCFRNRAYIHCRSFPIICNNKLADEFMRSF